MGIPALDNRTPEHTKVVLNHIGEGYYLNKIWVQGKDYGYEFPIPENVRMRERELNAKAATSVVAQTSTETKQTEERTEIAQAAPPPPDGLQATTISPTEIDLYWNNSDPTVTGYLIERQTGGGAFVQIANVAGVVNHFYQDLNVTAATQYTYRLRAQSPTGISVYTDPVAATTSPAPPAPSCAPKYGGSNGSKVIK